MLIHAFSPFPLPCAGLRSPAGRFRPNSRPKAHQGMSGLNISVVRCSLPLGNNFQSTPKGVWW